MRIVGESRTDCVIKGREERKGNGCRRGRGEGETERRIESEGGKNRDGAKQCRERV